MHQQALEKYIQEHRQAFDAQSPPPDAWSGIENALERMEHADTLERFIGQNRPLFDAAAAPLAASTQWPSGRLEGFIQQHRAEFDGAVPDLRVWADIEAALPTKKPKARIIPLGWHRHLLQAAASVALLVIGLGAGIWYARSSDAPEMTMAEVSPEYAELERYYERDINQKKEKLAVFTGSQSAGVFQDLEQLDRVMEELRQELAHVPAANRQQVVRAMIENYKAKTAILQRVLEHLENAQPTGRSNTTHDIQNM